MSVLDGIKTPIAATLNRVALQRASDALVSLGQELPCHVVAVQGQLVTVAFDVQYQFPLPQVTIPIATSVYDWIPIQKGDRGVTRAADASVAEASGQSTGTPNYNQAPANFGALVFAPIANATWSTEFQDFRIVQGPDGVILQDLAGACVLKLTASGIVISGPVTIDNNLTVTGETSFGGGAKKVVLDGDPVIGGVVKASSVTIKAT